MDGSRRKGEIMGDGDVLMAQKTIELKEDKPVTLREGTVWCAACSHVVPLALICLYCGAKLEERQL